MIKIQPSIKGTQIYLGKTQTWEKPNNLFLGEIVQFNKKYNLVFLSNLFKLTPEITLVKNGQIGLNLAFLLLPIILVKLIGQG